MRLCVLLTQTGESQTISDTFSALTMLATVREESHRKSTTPEDMPSASGQGSAFGCTKST